MEGDIRSDLQDNNSKDPVKLLPGYNCGACGEKRCDGFAAKLMAGKSSIEKCIYMLQERFSGNKSLLTELLREIPQNNRIAGNIDNPGNNYNPGNKVENKITGKDEIIGLIDGYRADFELKPLPGEPSCREVLFPFARMELRPGDNIKYRPLGCPVVHFAKILEATRGLITVHMIGPGNRIKNSDFRYEDIGVCMVGGFEGLIEGKSPFVGQTVRFLPHQCMMRKVHTGVVVQLIGERIVIEGIDLKVWAPPE